MNKNEAFQYAVVDSFEKMEERLNKIELLATEIKGLMQELIHANLKSKDDQTASKDTQ